MARILLLDDEEQIRRAVGLQLEKDGHEVVSREDGKKGLEALAETRFDLIITDLQMPNLDGIELLKSLDDDKTPAMVLTGFASVQSAVEAMKLGALDFITKPPQLEEISLKVRKILETQELVEENKRLRSELEDKYGFGEVIGKSPVMDEMFGRLKPLASDNDISILLTGESGTGKEIIAKSIHYNSPRKKKPFVAINCGALPEHLLESELFGHEKGAFTDAKELKMGLFETAEGGTLFLDEISAMPLSMQVKLLRALEERKIRRVGGTKEIPLDVRFIAASNQSLVALIEKEEFRQDLYYRLAVATVSIPALRNRMGDVRLLAHHFVENIGSKKERCLKISPDVYEALENHPWPGNVRELENLIELLVVTAASDQIELTDLPQNIAANSYIPSEPEFSAEKYGTNLKTATKRLTDRFEREFIADQLKKHRWNITTTAKAIGISRGALHAKMKTHGLSSEEVS